MRYVIVSAVKGKAGEFNDNLRRQVYEKFRAKSSKLPAHFTIKAPFEYDGELSDLDELLSNFTKREVAEPYKIDGFGHFEDRVVFMNVEMSDKAKAVHDRLIDEMNRLPYMEFTKKDGKNKIFHVTVTSKKIQPIFKDIWDYVNKYDCSYDCSFDNIRVYRWKDFTWKLYKEYDLAK